MADLWWHVYGGVTTETCSWGEGLWAMVIMGESPVSPDDPRISAPPGNGSDAVLKYLRSFDHDPTDEEKDALTPEEYLDA